MHRTRVFLALLILILGSAAPLTRAQGTEVTTRGLVGDGAAAVFQVTSGCFYTDASVNAGNLVSQEDGVATHPDGRPASAAVNLHYSNQCTGATVFFASGSATGVNFRVGPKLAWAELHATVPLFDHVSGTTVSVQVDVVWTATGELDQSAGADHYIDDDGAIIRFQHVSKFRGATASGGITDGTTDFVPAGTSGRAGLAWSRYGQIVIEF